MTAAGGPRGQWPVSLRDLSEVPEPLRTRAHSALGGEQPMHGLLVGPGWRPAGLWRVRPVGSRLVMCAGDRLLVLQGSEDGQPAASWEMRLDRLLALVWGQVPRYSWVRFVAAGSDKTSEAHIEYNTVGWASVWRLLVAVMARRLGAPAAASASDALALTDALPLKARNAVRHRLCPWDRLVCVAYQPRELAYRGRPRWGRRVWFPETVMAVTTHHVLLLGEDERTKPDETNWGTIATYVPLTGVRRVDVERIGDEARLHVTAGYGRTTWSVSARWAVRGLEKLRSAVGCIERAIRRADAPEVSRT
jgi:hypothetical protein